MTWVLAVALFYVFSVGVATQQAPAPAPAGPDMTWAFPDRVQKELPADATPKRAPGSAKTYTQEQIDDLLNPPDWYPEQHPGAPLVVTKGAGAALACGACHLMSGLGHPESSDLTGLSVPYMVQQMLDFKSGARQDPTGKRMNGIAQAITDEQARVAAVYFAKLPRKPFQKVTEAAMVPKTFLGNGRMRLLDPAGGTEPIAGRIITVPEDLNRARMRDPNSGFVSYVPVGSIARGKELVETGGGRTMACALCHGLDLKGQGSNPRLAGMHPIYTYRPLAFFKDGTRKGIDSSYMVAPVSRLTSDDMVAISAYLATLEP
jgi:cytochrome c553